MEKSSLMAQIERERIASQIAREAGNRSMKRANRLTWGVEDFEIAARARRLALLQLEKEGK